MSKNLVLRALETFFRRWWLYVIPVVLLTALGLYTVLGAPASYRSSTTVDVASSTLISSLSNVGNNPNYGYDPPATATAKQINSLLGTDQFVTDIAKAAGLTTALERGEITLPEVRASIAAFPAGTNFMKIFVSSRFPELSPRLAQATYEQFIALVVAGQVSDSAAAETFYRDRAEQYEADVTAAQAKVDAFVEANPIRAGIKRPESEQIQLDRLNAALATAQTRYDDAFRSYQDAQLAQEQAKVEVGQRLRIVDPPKAAVKQGGMKASLFTLLTYMAVGVLLALAAVAIATALDHSVRTANDLQSSGLRVLAVVPDDRALGSSPRRQARKSRRGRRRAAPEPALVAAAAAGAEDASGASASRTWAPPATAADADDSSSSAAPADAETTSDDHDQHGEAPR